MYGKLQLSPQGLPGGVEGVTLPNWLAGKLVTLGAVVSVAPPVVELVGLLAASGFTLPLVDCVKVVAVGAGPLPRVAPPVVCKFSVAA